MMTAQEALAMTHAYVENEVTNHITNIEEQIREKAGRGDTTLYYGRGLIDADSRIKRKVTSELENAGYELRWCQTTLFISWNRG